MDNKKKNTLALVGFIFSITISGLIGLILSIIGLNESKKNNDGRELAIAGIVIGSLRIVALLIIIAIPTILIPDYNYIKSSGSVCSRAYGCECNGDSCDCLYISEDGDEMTTQCPNLQNNN